MFRYSVVKPSYELRQLIELATRVACYELGCSLPDNVFTVAPDDDGKLESRSNVGGWHDDRGVFVVIAGRQPHEIVRTHFHECSHHADSLKYHGDLGAALEDHEASELRAREFAAEQTKDLPAAYSHLMQSLEHRLHMQKYPLSHAAAMVTARAELAKIELNEFDQYGEPN